MRGGMLTLSLAMLAGCGPQQEAKAPESANHADATVAVNEAVAPAETAAPSRRASRFTKLDEASCSKPKTVAETGDWDRTCEGVDGYALNWDSGDLREDLSVIKGGKATALGIPVKVANGAFNSIAPTVEWRGAEGAPADVLVVRISVANQTGKSDSGRLAVVRLGREPCIVGIVPPGPGQSDKARAIADGDTKYCLRS